MNNKGQVLVSFIILLPLILLLFTIVIDLGFMYIEKRNISNNTRDAVEYYLKNKDNPNVVENTKKLLNKNISDIEININSDNDYVEITISKNHKGIFNILKSNSEISITYKGNKNDNKVIKG